MAGRTEIQRFQQAQELLKRLRELGPDERSSLLDIECEDDDALREDVESLLAVEDDDGPDPLDGETSPGEQLRTFISSSPSLPAAPQCVGPHRIIRLIGEGGMGSVYEAEQAEPQRRIAVKVLRHGLASPDARRRFQRETELLGRLRHPGIAVLHEAGIDDTTRHGLPWFSMELVEGKPINVHAEETELTVDEKLDLLVQLCEAVAHAHQQGVVHRDLKPDNILVDGGGRVRILDFGIARAADAIGEGNTSLTRTGDVIGTLAYMSPEQALGRPDLVDGRSDLYSIGVIGYQLLTGRLPHDLSELTLPAALHEITEAETERLGSLDGSLRGDLDAIIGKALEKERDRRYATVDDLLADLQRYLKQEPVIARRPTLSYRLARFIQRNRAVSAALTLTIVTLVAAVIVTTRKAIEANANAADARRAQYVAQLQAASAALANTDPESARVQLDLAPEALRGFEWHHLQSRLDASLLHVELPSVVQWDSNWPVTLRSAGADPYPTCRLIRQGDVLDIDLVTGEWTVVWKARPGEFLLTLSPDGEHCLLRGSGRLVLAHLASDQRHDLAPEPPSHSESYLFSPGGQWAVVKSLFSPNAWVHSVPGGERVLEIQTEELDPQLAFASDRRLLIVDGRRSARLLELPSGRVLQAFGDSSGWGAIAVSDAGDRVVTARGGGSTMAFSLLTGEPLPWQDVPPTNSPARYLRFDDAGRWLVVSQDDRRQRLLDGRTGRVLHQLGRVVHATPWIRAFSTDGAWLATGTDSGVLKAQRLTSDQPPTLLPGHAQAARFLCFLPDSPLLLSVTDTDLRLWNVELSPRPVLRGHELYVYDLSVSPDGQHVASASWDGTVRVWDLATHRTVHVLGADRGHAPHGLVAYRPDGRILASVHDDELSLWDASTGALLESRTLVLPVDPDTQRTVGHWYQTQPIALAWHPDGTWLAVGSGGRPLQAWSVTGDADDLQVEADPWSREGRALAFSPDGTLLAMSTGGFEGPTDIELWSVRARDHVSSLSGHEDQVIEIEFSPDGRQVASVSMDGTARTWSLSNGEQRLVMRVHPEKAYAVTWSPDGQRLATGANDDDLRLWDAATGQELLSLQGHSDYIHALAWSPSGDLLVSGSGDGDLRLWDARTLRERARAAVGSH
ncbi:MAG: protein kinase [Acidobacteriota bacterium]